MSAPKHVHEPADVLIVGAGGSGAAVAWAVSGDTGATVVCLDRGGWNDARNSLSADDQWEVHRQFRWSPNPNTRGLAVDYPVDDAASPIKPLMWNGVGGSTILWSAHFPRFHPSDFRVQSLDGVADDWPVTYDDLADYYEANDALMGVSGLAGDPANPPREPRQMPPIPPGKCGERLAAAFDRLGWHWWPSDVATNSVPYGEGRGACNNCGMMELGCYQLAKASTDINYWPKALANGVELRTHARVVELPVDGAGRVTGAHYLDEAGELHFQPAARVVVACNGIGTPRLLLASRSERFPGGIANSSGLVGKNLMLHPFAAVIGIFEELLEGWKGPTACNIMSQEFYETDPARDYVRGFTLQALRSHGPAITALGSFATPLPWGRGHHTRFEQVFGRTAGLAAIAEDLPEEHNRVDVDWSRRDADGMPPARMTYRVGENTERILRAGTEVARELLREAGAVDVIEKQVPADSGFHLMGTARMGDDPARSVVDRWGRAHDVDNLFVVDGSTFVTCASINPTPTLQALALRTAHHIVDEL